MTTLLATTLSLLIGINISTTRDVTPGFGGSNWCPPDNDVARQVIDSFLTSPDDVARRGELGYSGAAPSEVVLASNNAVCEMLLWDPRNQPDDSFFPTIYRHVPSDRYIVVIVHEHAGKPIVTEEYIEFYAGPSVLVFFDTGLGELGRIML
jgi:hypothetical protein